MSTSPLARTRSRVALRAAIFITTVFASIATSTVVAGLDPAEQALVDSALATATPPQTAALAQAELPPVEQPLPIRDEPCSRYLADFCVEVQLPERPAADYVPSCRIDAEHDPAGSLDIVSQSMSPGDNPVRIRVEVETGLAVDGRCFSEQVLLILNDERGWSDSEDVSFSLVDNEGYDLRLILASPNRTDSLCYPARTGGRYSCRRGNTVVINLMRWESGTDDYERDLTTYRHYLLNHEVGHFLGKGHVGCPAAGELAPVMMQQTKGLGSCLPNGWPTKDEL